MRQNAFDLAMLNDRAQYDDQALAGWFSKLRKKVKKHIKFTKKIGDPFKKLRSKLGRKIFGDKNIEKLKVIEDKLEPVKRAAKIAVAAYFVGPLAGKAVGAAASSAGFGGAGQAITAYGAQMGSGTLVKAVGKAALQEAVKIGAKEAAQSKLRKKQENAEIAAMFQTAVAQINEAKRQNAATVTGLAKDREFQTVIQTQKAEGKSADQIAKEWAESATFKNTAYYGTYNQILPALIAEYTAAGMDPQTAQEAAKLKAHQIAANEVLQVEKKAGGGTLVAVAAIGIPLIFAAMGG